MRRGNLRIGEKQSSSRAILYNAQGSLKGKTPSSSFIYLPASDFWSTQSNRGGWCFSFSKSLWLQGYLEAAQWALAILSPNSTLRYTQNGSVSTFRGSHGARSIWQVWTACHIPDIYQFFFLVFLPFLGPLLMANGGSQARGLIGAIATGLHPGPQQHGVLAMSETYTTVHGNAGSLTHWAWPGIEATTSWFLVGFVNHCAMTGTLTFANIA